MARRTGRISADASLAQAKKSAPYFKKLLTGMQMHMHDGTASVREADYKGHHIVVETTYKITIDGTEFQGSLGVTDGGDVHYHGMPNVGFASAIDLVKAVIDTFPDEFAAGGQPSHQHAGEMTMPMNGMKMRSRRRAPAKRAVRRRR